MNFIVEPHRLSIQVKFDEGKSISFPGEWASNFFIDEKGFLSRKDYKDKFYADHLQELFWENDESKGKVDEAELKICMNTIQNEADKNGWRIIWSS